VTTPPASEHTPTPSLRRRVTRTVLAVIAVLLLVVGVAIDLALGVQLRRDVHDRRTAPCGQDPHFAGTSVASSRNTTRYRAEPYLELRT
jgi:hypothetical protein